MISVRRLAVTSSLLLLFVISVSYVSSEAYADTDPFITIWKTTEINEPIIVPVGGASGTYTINWGDGIISADITGDQTHWYAAAGNYTVSISGNFERIYLGGNSVNAKKLQSIEQWGDIRWSTMNSALHAASNMVYNAVDSPNLSSVTDMSGMFSSSSFNGDISEWDVSSVTYMSYMFCQSPFSGDISEWDVSSVTYMSYMFCQSPFSGDISEWDVSSVTDMYRMFWGASFNGDISEWDVSSVTYMSDMFWETSFNGDISEWDVSSVTYMSKMFSYSSFNGNLGNWYITLDNTSITEIPGIVGNITAQNKFLAAQGPTYSIGSGGDSEHFDINGTELILMTVPDDSPATVNITATTGFETTIIGVRLGSGQELETINMTSARGFDTSNSRIFEITFTPITVPDNIAPRIVSIERNSPVAQITDSQTLVYRVIFSEDVMGVNIFDFTLSPDSTGGSGTGPVTDISGFGSVYYVTVLSTQDGAYNIDLISSGHGITDTAGNPLTNASSASEDHTYTVTTS